MVPASHGAETAPVLHGPCFAWIDGMWTRRNTSQSCESCRERRIRCFAFAEGAPCGNCQRYEVPCKLLNATFPYWRIPTCVYRPIYPPPFISTNSPSSPVLSPFGDTEKSNATESQEFVQALIDRLAKSGVRPAPLVWPAPPEKKPSSSSNVLSRGSQERAAISSTKAAKTIASESHAVPEQAIETSQSILSQYEGQMEIVKDSEPINDVVRDPFFVTIAPGATIPTLLYSRQWQKERWVDHRNQLNCYSPYRKRSLKVESTAREEWFWKKQSPASPAGSATTDETSPAWHSRKSSFGSMQSFAWE